MEKNILQRCSRNKILSIVLSVVMLFSMFNGIDGLFVYAAEEVAQESVLTCGKEEHGHTEACYVDGVRVCTIEAHAHTQECYSLVTLGEEAAKAEDVPETEAALETVSGGDLPKPLAAGIKEISAQYRSAAEVFEALTQTAYVVMSDEEFGELSQEDMGKYAQTARELLEEALDAYSALTDEEMETFDEEHADWLMLALQLQEKFGMGAAMYAASGSGTLPGARSESDSAGNVFLGGNYMEVGVSKSGSFGTSKHPVGSGWHDSLSFAGLGLQVDGDGWNVGNAPTTGDFFLPGTPDERWVLSYTYGGETYHYVVADRMVDKNLVTRPKWGTDPVTTDQSDLTKGLLKAVTTATTKEGVEIELVYSFDKDDKYYSTQVNLKNATGDALSDVYFCRSFDPDQDQQLKGTYTTYNKVICNPDTTKEAGDDNCAMVVARGEKTLEGVFFVAFDTRATAACGYDFPSVNTATYILASAYTGCDGRHAPADDVIECTAENKNGYVSADKGMGITFQIGAMANGAFDSLEYYTSLDPDVLGSIKKLKALHAKIDFDGENVDGLTAGAACKITIKSDTDDKGKVYMITVAADGSIPMEGKDQNGNEFNLIGKTFDMVYWDLGEDEALSDVTELTIPYRPPTPKNPETGLMPTPKDAEKMAVELGEDSITVIKPEEGHVYALVPAGSGTETADWVPAGEDGKVHFTDLPADADYTVYTKIPATESSLTSLLSPGLVVTHEERAAAAAVTVTGYDGVYDGKPHGIVVSAEGATVTYSAGYEEEYGEENPVYMEACTPQTVYCRVERTGCIPLYKSAVVSISKKDVTITGLAAQDKVYDGTATATITGTAVIETLVDGDEDKVSVSTGTANFDNKNAGAGKPVTFTGFSLTGEKADNYNLVAQPAAVTAEIFKKPFSFEWDETEFTYDGTLHTPTVKNVSGVVDGEDCTISVSGGQTDAGSYPATASLVGADAANYELPVPGDTVEFVIHPKLLTEDMVTIDDSTDHSYVYTGSVITPALTVKDGTLLTPADYDVSGTMSAADYGNYTMTVTGKRNYTGEVGVSWWIKDLNAPSGSIRISTDGWTSFWNGVTFGKFFKEKQKVTITGTDNESGVDKIYYYLTDTELSGSEAAALAEWTQLSVTGTDEKTKTGSFYVDPNKKFVVYAKVTDHSGNVLYFNSDGVVLDGTPPVIAGVANGKTYCDEQTITVTDTYLDKVTVDGKEVTLTDLTLTGGKYTLAAKNKTYTVVATDKAGNSSTVTVTVNDGHTPVTDAGKEPTCVRNGLTGETHCSVCDALLSSETEILALGHDWGEWQTVKLPTLTEEGKKERLCSRCDWKNVKKIPKLQGVADKNGNFEKDAELAPGTPIRAVTMDNSKAEFIHAPVKSGEVGIWESETERQQVEDRAVDARIWLELSPVTPSASEQERMEEKAASVMGEGTKLTYFDANLFKNVGDGAIKTIHDPGMDIVVTITLPQEAQNVDPQMIRDYHVVRLHEGIVDVLPGTYEEATGEVTFVTDRFSVYGLAYRDTPKDSDEEPAEPPKPHRLDAMPRTGYGADPYKWFLTAIFSGMGAMYFALKGRKEKLIRL